MKAVFNPAFSRIFQYLYDEFDSSFLELYRGNQDLWIDGPTRRKDTSMPNARPVRVQFLFGSPNVYPSGRFIPDIEKRTGVTFDVPVLLGGIFAAKPQDQAIKNRLMELTQDAVVRAQERATMGLRPSTRSTV
jgi:hypothetical protein